EFADLEPNTGLLERLRSMTDGRSYEEDVDALAEVTRSGQVFRAGAPKIKSLQPIWFWLVLLTGILLFFDVAVRRIAIEPLAVAVAAQRFWDRLRGRAAVKDTTPQFLDRLKSRKAQIGETLERERATRRVEPADASVGASPPSAHEVPGSSP